MIRHKFQMYLWIFLLTFDSSEGQSTSYSSFPTVQCNFRTYWEPPVLPAPPCSFPDCGEDQPLCSTGTLNANEIQAWSLIIRQWNNTPWWGLQGQTNGNISCFGGSFFGEGLIPSAAGPCCCNVQGINVSDFTCQISLSDLQLSGTLLPYFDSRYFPYLNYLYGSFCLFFLITLSLC